MKLPRLHRMRADRTPREERRAADARGPVRYRIARAVGTAASGLPESRAVQVGTAVGSAVVSAVAAHPGMVRAGLTAANAVPVLRPYVRVALAATTAIGVAGRVVRAKRTATNAVSALRGRREPMPYAGNGFGLGPPALGIPAPDPQETSADPGPGSAATRRTSTERGREP
jgi:hypothetical protein